MRNQLNYDIGLYMYIENDLSKWIISLIDYNYKDGVRDEIILNETMKLKYNITEEFESVDDDFDYYTNFS